MAPSEPLQKGQVKRKAGGTGKKGKTFMEDKVGHSLLPHPPSNDFIPPPSRPSFNDDDRTDASKSSLLSLVSGITASKAALAQSKVDKVKPNLPPPSSGANSIGPGGSSSKNAKAKASAKIGAGGIAKKTSTAGQVKRAEKEKALVCPPFLSGENGQGGAEEDFECAADNQADAKAVILEKRRAKKARKHEREGGAAAGGGEVAVPTKSGKTAKKVGFA